MGVGPKGLGRGRHQFQLALQKIWERIINQGLSQEARPNSPRAGQTFKKTEERDCTYSTRRCLCCPSYTVKASALVTRLTNDISVCNSAKMVENLRHSMLIINFKMV